MSDKKRQKKDGQDKNKKTQARHADHDVDHRSGTAPQSHANSQGGYGAQERGQDDGAGVRQKGRNGAR